MQVAARRQLQLHVDGDVEFWLYFHDHGEQYYLHEDYWPKVPPYKHVRKVESSIDVVIRKEMTISGNACKQKDDYFYFGELLSMPMFIEVHDINSPIINLFTSASPLFLHGTKLKGLKLMNGELDSKIHVILLITF